jgi:transposase InsO family protein
MSVEQKSQIIDGVQQACSDGARQRLACDIVGISPKALQRWVKADCLADKRQTVVKKPKNKLSAFEQARVIAVANSEEFADSPPSQMVPKLADKGIYIASESTMYRTLKAHDQLTKRESSRTYNHSKPTPFVATGPNQIYCWNITYLPSQVKGIFFYLYMVMDIFSRKIVGWQAHDNESSALASDLMVDICRRENIKKDQVVLHSDNGSPMKGATMLATLQQLGVMPSFSRPSVSNDNPYSESLFRTFKYRPSYPEKKFKTLTDARLWIEDFVSWYNNSHCHSGIQFVCPAQRHENKDTEILAKRHEVYQMAKAKNPERWSGNTRNWTPIKEVALNPNKAEKKETTKAA